MLYFCIVEIIYQPLKKQSTMSRKSSTVRALENAQTTTTRIKENYRFSGINSRESILIETDKSISSVIRSGIKSLLINMLSDSNVDLLTVTFFYEDTDSSSILDSRYDKYSIVRNGEFVQISIDNFLLDTKKVCSTTKIKLSIIYTNIETFETVSESRTAVLPEPEINADFFSLEHKLVSIYKAFVHELV